VQPYSVPDLCRVRQEIRRRTPSCSPQAEEGCADSEAVGGKRAGSFRSLTPLYRRYPVWPPPQTDSSPVWYRGRRRVVVLPGGLSAPVGPVKGGWAAWGGISGRGRGAAAGGGGGSQVRRWCCGPTESCLRDETLGLASDATDVAAESGDSRRWQPQRTRLQRVDEA